MSRRPQPGGDRNAWGGILNSHLAVSINEDGTIKPEGVANAVTAAVETALSVQLGPAVAAEVAADPTVAAAAAEAIDAEPRVSQLISDTNDLTNKMAAVEQNAVRTSTQLYDTRAFSTIQAAIDACHGDGGGTVFLADNEPTPQTLTLRDGVYLTGRGIGATELHVNTITGTGSVTPLPGLGATVSTNSRTITFASAHGLQPGDVFSIYDTTNESFNTARPYYRAGEFCRVKTVVNSTQVTITHPTYDGYSTGAARELYKLNPIRTGVSNMTLKCTTGQHGINIEHGSDLVFSQLDMSGTDYAHINLARCYGVSISNVKAFDSQPGVGLNYGIVIGNSQRVRISDVELETTRHGLVTGHGGGSSTGPNRLPVRDLIVSNSFINGLSPDAGVCGCNLHGNSEFVRFVNCTFPSGANPAGDNIEYRDCTFGSAEWGCAVQCMEMLGTNLSFIGCTFNATDNFDYETGFIHLRFQGACRRPHCSLVFHDNVINLGTASSGGPTHNAIVVRMVGSAASIAVRHASFRNNIIHAASTTNRLGIRIVTLNTDQWTHLEYIDNGGRLGPQVDFTAAGIPVYFEGHGGGAPTFVAQRGSNYYRRATAGADTGRLYVNQNGDSTWTMK